jgi:uncharacterized protein (TIGR03086 family)
MDPLSRLGAAVGQARPIISAVSRDRYDEPTPCTDWSVGQLINHMIGGLTMFRDVGIDGQADPALFSRDLIGEDATASFDAAGAAALEAWGADGKMAGTASLPFGEFPAAFALQLPAMDMVVHGWDLAKATGQEVNWDRDLIAETLAFCEATFTTPEFRGNDFAPAVELDGDPDDLSRLVAFLGRQP